MYGETLITPAVGEPITEAEAKTHLGIPPGLQDYDVQIATLMVAARMLFEEQTNRQVITATRRFSFDGFPAAAGAPLLIPRPPLQSVTSIEYTDETGATMTLDSAKYRVETSAEPGHVYLKEGETWPLTRLEVGAVRVEAVCGYGDASVVPSSVRALLLQFVDDWFNERAGQGEIGESQQRLLDTHKTGDMWLTYGRGC